MHKFFQFAHWRVSDNRALISVYIFVQISKILYSTCVRMTISRKKFYVNAGGS